MILTRQKGYPAAFVPDALFGEGQTSLFGEKFENKHYMHIILFSNWFISLSEFMMELHVKSLFAKADNAIVENFQIRPLY